MSCPPIPAIKSAASRSISRYTVLSVGLAERHKDKLFYQKSINSRLKFRKMFKFARVIYFDFMGKTRDITNIIESDYKEILLWSVAVLPWFQNLLILSKNMDNERAIYYVTENISKGWNRDLLLNEFLLDGKTCCAWQLGGESYRIRIFILTRNSPLGVTLILRTSRRDKV